MYIHKFKGLYRGQLDNNQMTFRGEQLRMIKGQLEDIQGQLAQKSDGGKFGESQRTAKGRGDNIKMTARAIINMENVDCDEK